MVGSNYFIRVKNQYNVPVLDISEFYKLELFRSELGVGSLYIDLPLKDHLMHNISTEWRIEVYRRAAGGSIVRVGDTQWIVKLVRYKVDEQNESYLHLLAYDPIVLLEKRIVAYIDGTTYTSKTMPADDMIKMIIRENLGDLAVDYRRDLSEWLSIEDAHGEAPEVTKTEFSFQTVSTVINDICALSQAAGVYLSYDIIYDETLGKLVFKTFVGQRGVNRGSTSQSPIYLAHHTDPVNVMGSGLSYASIEIDASDERSYVYSGRQSEESNAIFGEVENQLAIDTGPFARTEDFITTGESIEYNDVMTEAHAWLQHKYRNLLLNAHIQETKDMRFGVDYGFGDIVALRYLGTVIDIHLDEFKITVGGSGKETISVISANMEKELLIPPLTGLDAQPIVRNEPVEEEDAVGAPLFYKYHTVAQSFTHDKAATIDYIKVFMRRSGLPERSISLTLCEDNGAGAPGSVIAHADHKNYTNMADGLYTWVRFLLTQSTPIIANKIYWIVMTCGIAKGEYKNYYRIGIDPNARFGLGSFRVSVDGANFVKFTEFEIDEDSYYWAHAGVDVPFKTYTNKIVAQHLVADSWTNIHENATGAVQQFHAPSSSITNLRLRLRKDGGPGDFTVKLCEWDYSANKPGAVLAQSSLNRNQIARDTFEWYDFMFPALPTLSDGSMYCLWMTASFEPESYYHIAIDTNAGYASGGAFTYHSGVCTPINADAAFEIYGLSPYISFTTTTDVGSLDVGKNYAAILQTFVVGYNPRIFRVGTYVARVGNPQALKIDLCLMDGEKPGTVLATATIPSEAVQEQYAWVEQTMSGPELSPTETYCLKFSGKMNDNNYYMFKCDANRTFLEGDGMIEKKGGAANADSDMLFRVGSIAP